MSERIEADLAADSQGIVVLESSPVRAFDPVGGPQAVKTGNPVLTGTAGTVVELDATPGGAVRQGGIPTVIA